jgi:hypothetical protein
MLPATAKVTAVIVKCAIKQNAADADIKAAAGGDCPELIAKSRAWENRDAAVHRQLEITYAYTSPKDGSFHQGKAEREQTLDVPVPRVGDNIDVLVHPEQAELTSLP